MRSRLAVERFRVRDEQKEGSTSHGNLGISLNHLAASGCIFLHIWRRRIWFLLSFRHDSNVSFPHEQALRAFTNADANVTELSHSAMCLFRSDYCHRGNKWH